MRYPLSVIARYKWGRVLAVGGLVVVALALTSSLAVAAPKSVVIIPSSSHVSAVVAAAGRLNTKRIADVTLRVVDSASQTQADLDAIAQSDIFILFNVGQLLARDLAPTIARQKQHGGRAWVVGEEYTDVERQSGFLREQAWADYAVQGGIENYHSLLTVAYARARNQRITNPPLVQLPEEALWEPTTGHLFEQWTDFEREYFAHRPAARGRRWVGVPINRGQAVSGQLKIVNAVAAALESRGFNVAVSVGYPADGQIERFYFDEQGKARVVAIAAMAMKFGNIPDHIVPILTRLDVPVVNAVTAYNKTRAEWEASPIGIPQEDRSWQIANPEFAGAVAPTVIGSSEHRHDEATGIDYKEETPIPERVALLADRVKALVALRTDAASKKRVALVYYNYPPGQENIGASYLNVMPQSLWQMLTRLEREGYTTTGRPADTEALFRDVTQKGVNINASNPGELERLVRRNSAVLLPVSEYTRWTRTLPAALIDAMNTAWGKPEDATIMTWRDDKGVPYFVFPVVRYGNIVLAPQPTRGWDQDSEKALHEIVLPPHHQYLAFYLWLQKGLQANAVVHIGTHGTMEWMPGKEIGQSAADPSEAMLGALPVMYPYIMDVIGEGLQARRRGMAALISYLTPPMDKAGLNPELVKLRALLDNYTVAAQKSDTAAEGILEDINKAAAKMGLLKDLGKTVLVNTEDVEQAEHYLREVEQKQTPFGLHTFGVPPDEAHRRATAEAVVGDDGEFTGEAREREIASLMQVQVDSAAAELDALVRGLRGGYIAAGPGGDPMRRPDAMPTGRNLYGFDPSRLPTEGVYSQGQRLATQLVDAHRQKHKAYPKRLVFTLWSNETMRHEGVTESEILALLGAKPKWDKRGRIIGVDVISRRELGRPRVDVTVIASGLYRDSLPVVMQLIDSAVSAVKDLDEPDNAVYLNVVQAKRALIAKGVAADEAARMAAVRMFTEPTGAYGAGVETVAHKSNTWSDEADVANVFFNREGHLFGQGYWGDRPGGAALAVDIFKMSLKGTEAIVHSRSSNVYGTLDNDDVFQYMGGAAMAVRQIDGKTPEATILNLANPKAAGHESLDQFMGKEMRSRYLNPEWIDSMLKEGYSGARSVMQVTDNLWGWQVTVPEAVDGAKWQEMYETYVEDRNKLDIRDRIRQSGNLRAYQGMVDRMLVAVNKGYWKADANTVATLRDTNRSLMNEAGVACDADSCSDQDVATFAKQLDARAHLAAGRMPAPNIGAMIARGRPAGAPAAGAAAASSATAAASPAPPAAPAPNPVVRGKQITEVVRKVADAPRLVASWAPWLAAAFLVACGFLLGGVPTRIFGQVDRSPEGPA